MAVLAAIGDISRFEDASKLVGYAGLGAGVHESGKTHKEKKITKKGRRELRWAMVEAAWRAIGMSPFWKAEYEKYLHRLRKPNQAIVVIARKLLIVVWHVLSKQETDEHASEEDLAYKMLLLSWSLSEEVRLGLTYKQFAKYALMKLGVETDITRFVRRNVPRRLAPKDEVLARLAELLPAEASVRRVGFGKIRLPPRQNGNGADPDGCSRFLCSGENPSAGSNGRRKEKPRRDGVGEVLHGAMATHSLKRNQTWGGKTCQKQIPFRS